jgi:hypothetical protein
MKVLNVLLGLLLVTAVVSAGYAETGKAKKAEVSCKDEFVKLDTDKDGKLSLKEFSAGNSAKKKAEAKFKMKDKNKDKALTEEEFCAK